VPLQHVSFASFCDLAERFEALDGGLRVVAGSQSVHHETAAVEWRYIVGLLRLSASYEDVDVPAGVEDSVVADVRMGAQQLEMAPVGMGAGEWDETLREAGRSFRDGLEQLCGVDLNWGYLQGRLGPWQEVTIELDRCSGTEITGTVTNESTSRLAVGVQVWFYGEDGLMRTHVGTGLPIGPEEGGLEIGTVAPGETREWDGTVPDGFSGFDTCEAHVGYARID
jgi:hypothetical protein